MPEQNSRIDPQDRSNTANRPAVSASTKGEGSGSHPPSDPEATLVDFPQPAADTGPALKDFQATQIDTSPPPRPGGKGRSHFQNFVPALQLGDVLGGRYEILQLLGEGGMGAVYKAMGRELDRPVALKLIRPELASSPAMLARFKQELLLAHQVTHKNVIRIYDLGDAD
ncbi:MAG TPA: hypothetical protein VHW45_14630, partial [Candidatus Sulfotelmatobacter sp.]|nr:hypothetical protein [Candidatus Sulfotelmatobacter sp.]